MKGIKIEFEIDNFSGLIEVSELNLPVTHKKGVYFLYGENENLLYIGKSINDIRGRLRTHLFAKPSEYWSKGEKLYLLEKREHYKYFAFSEIPTEHISMCEIFLINKFKPLFNIDEKPLVR